MHGAQGEPTVKTPFRWAGSKRQLIPYLSDLVPTSYGRYLEPFAGSARLYFALRPREALLADYNKPLIQTYLAIRDHPTAFYLALSSFNPLGEDYYSVRTQFNEGVPGITQAARFLYLNRFGFNGVYRTNKLNHYNVPRGSRTGRLPTKVELARLSEALGGTDFKAADFRQTFAEAKRGDLLYVDPPYTTTLRPTYGEYGVGSFGGSVDLSDLSHALGEATERGVNIILSFGDTGELDDAIGGWQTSRFRTPRRISAKIETRQTMYHEIVATNFNHAC